MSDLKPCPFCGGKASIRNLCGIYWVGCDSCKGNNSDAHQCCAGCARAFDTPEKAAAAWNRRANEKPEYDPLEYEDDWSIVNGY